MGAPKINYQSIAVSLIGFFPIAGRTLTLDHFARLLEREFAPLLRQAHMDGRADGLNRSIMIYVESLDWAQQEAAAIKSFPI